MSEADGESKKTDDESAIEQTTAPPETPNDDEVADAEIVQEAIRLGEERGVVEGIAFAVQSSSGPLPSADEFDAYGTALASAPDRILTMAEKQLDHKIKQDNRSGLTDQIATIAGLIFAFLLALVVLSGSIWLISEGFAIAGTILATLDLVALVTTFILGRRQPG